MTTSADLLVDAFDRVRGLVHRVVDGLTADELAERLDPQANSIGWLVWHLARVEDDHVAEAFGREQIWLGQGWEQRFGLPFHPSAIGYRQTSDEVAAVRVESGKLLADYYDAVHEQTVACVRSVTPEELDRVVDRNWNPPVTLAVRLISVVGDTHQHIGQADFVRGVLLRRR